MSRTWDDHTRDQIYTSVQPWRDVTRLTEQHSAILFFFRLDPSWSLALTWSYSTQLIEIEREGLLMYQLFVRVQRWRPIPLRQLFYPVFVIPRCSARIGTDVWTHAGLAYVPACHRESFCVVPDCHKLEWIVLPMLPTGTQLPDKRTQVKMRTFQPFGLYLLASTWSKEIWIGQHVTFT